MTTATHPSACSLAELEREAPSTRSLLAAVPADKLGWRPHERSMTLGELSNHVATNFGVIAGFLSADAFDFEDAESVPVPESVDEILANFDAGVDAARTALSRWSEADLAAVWNASKGGQPLMTLSRAVGVRMLMFSHMYHHRGQLSVYLRLLDAPVPSVYGPTADVNPFE
jgi:uncharacterized damage-inducible protein DinB